MERQSALNKRAAVAFGINLGRGRETMQNYKPADLSSASDLGASTFP